MTGYRGRFGTHVQYLVVGGLKFSSAAWRMRARDRWIAGTTERRARHLPQVVNNSRFLVLTWVHVQNLAGAALALALRRLPADWQAQYDVTPLLVETLVDPARYNGRLLSRGEFGGRGKDGGTRPRMIASITATAPGPSAVCLSVDARRGGPAAGTRLTGEGSGRRGVGTSPTRRTLGSEWFERYVMDRSYTRAPGDGAATAPPTVKSMGVR